MYNSGGYKFRCVQPEYKQLKVFMAEFEGAMASKTVLTALVVVLMVFSQAIARDQASYEEGRRDGRRDGDLGYPSVAQEKLKEKLQEESDRKQRVIQEEREERANDANRESTYRQSKAAHRKKVTKMRKRAGSKLHNSWQLMH